MNSSRRRVPDWKAQAYVRWGPRIIGRVEARLGPSGERNGDFEAMCREEAGNMAREKSGRSGDIVVTVPRERWEEFLAGGGLPGDPPAPGSAQGPWTYDLFNVEELRAMPGQRIFFFAYGKLRLWAPVFAIERVYKRRWRVWRGPAEAATLDGYTYQPGFPGWRLVWWPAHAEAEFPGWRDIKAPARPAPAVTRMPYSE